MLDRSRALEILGLSEGADEAETRAAYRVLREHVEARTSTADEARADARRDELRDLERAWRALSSSPPPTGVIQPTRPLGERRSPPSWVLVWAAVATLLAVGLAVYVAWPGGRDRGPLVLLEGMTGGDVAGDGDGGYALEAAGSEGADSSQGGIGEILDAGPRARLVVESDVEGAWLEVRARGDDPAMVAEGAADDSVYWLSPGAYAVTVHHPDCRDSFEQELDVEGDERLQLEPEICKDTGWMVVRSNVADDALEIDGKLMGATGDTPRPVSAGEHAVRVSKPGYQAWEGIVDVEPGQSLGIRPRLEAVKKAQEQRRKQAAAPAQVASAPSSPNEETRSQQNWHEDARRWLLSRYDFDRSAALDSREEVEAVPCDHWIGLEQSYDQSRLGLSLTRFYGFDGSGWRSGALGVSDDARDLAYERMQSCGLR